MLYPWPKRQSHHPARGGGFVHALWQGAPVRHGAYRVHILAGGHLLWQVPQKGDAMLVTKEYDRAHALTYAARWALSRNPLYFNYAGIGGNCTNFVSQCLYAGACTMNYTPVYGWYYLSQGERTASWTGVEYFYNFLTGNRDVGPFGHEVARTELEAGDVIQLGREESGYYHSLLVVAIEEGEILVAAQSDDAYRRPLSTYAYDYARFLHVDGVRLSMPDTADCFLSLLNGEAILPSEASAPPLPLTVPEEPTVPEEAVTPEELTAPEGPTEPEGTAEPEDPAVT